MDAKGLLEKVTVTPRRAAGVVIPRRLRSDPVGERYGMVLVPITSQYPEASSSTDDLVARRQRDGWQLVSARVDSEGAEILVFRRPA